MGPAVLTSVMCAGAVDETKHGIQREEGAYLPACIKEDVHLQQTKFSHVNVHPIVEWRSATACFAHFPPSGLRSG